jgi:hypothetical protein
MSQNSSRAARLAVASPASIIVGKIPRMLGVAASGRISPMYGYRKLIVQLSACSFLIIAVIHKGTPPGEGVERLPCRISRLGQQLALRQQ